MRECILILDNIRSVENVGSILRTSDGLGVSKVILIGTTPTPLDRFGRKRSDMAKVALGAEESVKWEYYTEATGIIRNLKEEGFQIIALEQGRDAEDLKDFKPSNKFVLVVGNEVDGVSSEALALADASVEIGMQGTKESFNVSVATGIALFRLL